MEPIRGGYTEEERGDIRRQLLSYMERHRIGTPTLQARIAQAGGRSNYEVNNKTLQRFLAARHRTNDGFVWLCHKFLLGVDAEDPVREFGDAACRFHQFETDEAALAGGAGTYEISGAPDDGENKTVPYGSLTLRRVPGRPYLRATETVSNRHAVAGRDGAAAPFLFEGAALIQAKGISVILRDVLTRLPKLNLLYEWQPAPGAYHGTIVERIFMGRRTGANIMLRVSMQKNDGTRP